MLISREYILDKLEAGNKFIVFAHHKEMMDKIETEVAKKDFRFIRIDGRTSSEARTVYVEQFQTKEEIRLAILSITSANAGINLTAASTVVFAELFWNPGVRCPVFSIVIIVFATHCPASYTRFIYIVYHRNYSSLLGSCIIYIQEILLLIDCREIVM